MSAAKHTPGPWEFDPVTGRVDAVAFRKPTGFKTKEGEEYIGGLVALPYSCSESSVNRDENARLIAAAPELLAVLQTIVRVADGRTVPGNLILDENSPLMDAARDAIAKAVGGEVQRG